MFRQVCLAAWVLLLLPLAAAQPPAQPTGHLAVAGPTEPIDLARESASVPVELEWSCSQEELAAGPATLLTVEFAARTTSPDTVLTLSPQSLSVPAYTASECVDGRPHVAQTLLTMVLGRNTPAFVPYAATVEARIRQAKDTGGSNEWGPYTADFTYEADYVAGAKLDIQRYAVFTDQADQWAPYNVTVTSDANGPSRITATFTARAEGVETRAPPATTFAVHGETQTLVVEARILATHFRPAFLGSLNLTVRTESADPRGADAYMQSAQLLIQVEDSEASYLPGPSAAALLLVVGVGGLAARLVRRPT